MKGVEEAINSQDYFLSNSWQYFEVTIYSVFSFLIPFLIGSPQIAVGIVVNALLIVSALNIKGYKLLPVIILPSVAMLARGVLFGPFTVFLIYLIPFIWVGNAFFVLCFKLLKLKLKMNYWLTLCFGTLLKSGFLFFSAFALYKIGIIPAVFLTAMGLMQAVTAVLGGIAAYGMHNIKKAVC